MRYWDTAESLKCWKTKSVSSSVICRKIKRSVSKVGKLFCLAILVIIIHHFEIT